MGVRTLGLAAIAVALCVPIATSARARPAQVPATDGTPRCGIEGAEGASPPADDGELRIATYNLLHSETDDGDVSLGPRLPLLAQAIVDSGADIAGIQEATSNLEYDAAAEAPQRHGLVAQRLAAELAARTGEAWSWCFSRSNPHMPGTPDLNVGGGNPLDDLAAQNGNLPDPGDFAEGLAIVTRYSIAESRFRRLPPRSYEAPACVTPDPICRLDAIFDSRQVLWARVSTPTGSVDTFTTHLAHHLTPLSDTTKLLQAQAAVTITEEWATDDALPDVLLGDFNSEPGSAAMAATATAGFVDTYDAAGGVECVEPGAAGCSGGPADGDEVWTDIAARPMVERIDYVLARAPAGCALTVPASRRFGDTPAPLDDGQFLWPSDHYAFVSTLRCTAQAAGTDPALAGTPGPARNATGLPATGTTPVAPALPALAALGALTVLAATAPARAKRRLPHGRA